MKNGKELLKNLVFVGGYSKATLKAGVAALRPFSEDLYAVHIRIDHSDPLTWRKKKYYHVAKQEICTRLDEWIFEHLVDQKEYASFLDRYRPMTQTGKMKKDIDEYIMDRHYRPKAIRMLCHKKGFDLTLWKKKRTRLEYSRRANLYWQDGEEFRFDFRNPVESLFIRKKGSDREVLGIGGSGSSGQRQKNTFFTAVLYILSKKAHIQHYLFEYDGFNRLKYIGSRYCTILTPGFGSNFNLDMAFMEEISKRGVYWK